MTKAIIHTLPSNKKFGIFFSLIFLILYLYLSNYFFLTTSVIFLFLSFFYSSFLQPLNKLWFKLGMLLGNIVSPVVLGSIFFLLITPISVIGKIFKRDHLKINLDKNIKTYWIRRDNSFAKEDFNNQF
jgi:hypothetical protein